MATAATAEEVQGEPSGAAGVPPAHGLLAGFGKVDVTPPLEVPYLSYYPRQTPFQGVHDRLYARALAVEGPTRNAAAVVALDSLGLSRGVLDQGPDYIATVRAEVERRTGIPGAHVLLAASHAHSTPQSTDIADLAEVFPGAGAWLEVLAGQIAEAVARAWAGRRPAVLRGTTGLCPGVAWNRRILTRDGRLVRLAARPPDDQVLKEPRDDRVPLLLVSDATSLPGDPGHWRGALMGFTCHPTTVQVQPLVSADYPGVACATVERELEAEACLFLQGACGDVGPVRATTGFRDVAVYGRALGGEALRCLSLLEAPDVPPMSPSLAIASEVVEVPRRPLPDAAALAIRAAALQHEIRDAPDDAARREAIGRLPAGGRAPAPGPPGDGAGAPGGAGFAPGRGPDRGLRGGTVRGVRHPPQGGLPRGRDLRRRLQQRLRGLHPHPGHLGRGGLRGLPRPLDAGGAGRGGRPHRARHRPRPSGLGRRA